jgi:hypothetical protein
LYDHRVAVGGRLAGQSVTVRLAAESQEWVFTQEGIEVGRRYAANLGAEAIRGLQVSRRPGRSAERTRRRHALRLEEAAGAVAPPSDPDDPRQDGS